MKDSLLLFKHEKYQICVMDFVSHRGINLVLFGRPAIEPACLFDAYLFVRLKSPLLKKCLSDLYLYKAVESSALVIQL